MGRQDGIYLNHYESIHFEQKSVRYIPILALFTEDIAILYERTIACG